MLISLGFFNGKSAYMVKIYIDPKIVALRRLHGDLFDGGYQDKNIRDWLSSQANTLLDGHRAGNSAVTFHLGCWSPDFVGADSAHIMSCTLTLAQVQETIAREYGYDSWSEVETLQSTMLDAEFERTVDYVIEGDVSQVQKQLRERPELVSQRSQYGHRATLLHYLGANGVESYRQITPLNAAKVARCIILGGADVNARAEMYGGSTALSLVLTSAHPHNAGVAEKIAEVLKNSGAS